MSISDTPTLNDVCEFIVDCLHKTAPRQEIGYPSIRTPNVGRGRLILDGVYRVSEETYQEWTRRAIPEKNDLIMAREAPAGNVAIIKNGQTVCLGQRTVHLRPNQNKVDPDFICYFLLTPKQRGKLLAGETGATAGHINMRDIRRLTLEDLPDLPIQKRIGDILSAYDDLIENNRRRIALLEQAARELYKEWFVRLKFPGHEQTKITDGLPEGWELKTVSELVEINPTEQVEKGKPIRHVPMASLSETGMTISTSLIENRNKSTSVKFRNNDTLLARITPCLENGKTGFVYFLDECEVGCGSTEYIVLRGRKGSPYFTYCMARDDEFRGRAIKSMIGSSGRQRVQANFMNDFFIYFPPDDILNRFNLFVENCFEQVFTLDRQNAILAQARDLLLPRLMSGRLSV